MYPTSNSSSPSQPSRDSTGGGGAPGSLARYRSAPGSFLAATVDSVINGHRHHDEFSANNVNNQMGGRAAPSRFFSPPHPNMSSQPFCPGSDSGSGSQSRTTERLQTTSFGLNDYTTVFDDSNHDNLRRFSSNTDSTLLRQSSSPAGFLNGLVSSFRNDGRASRTSSQLNFSGTNSLSHITEERDIVGNSVMFSSTSSRNKRAKIDINGLNVLDSELHFDLSESALETATMEKLMDIPQDSVPCKIRAKRGCATHPRSIAERERRTRISGKLKKLQDLVPNMDKQTSYADMLDLAVQHIKGLQSQVQNLHKELQNCKCGCKSSL